jgi:urate oxidase
MRIVLKSSGSSFENFIRDEFTTLPEAAERILSTAVDMEYEFPAWKLEGDVEVAIGKMGAMLDVAGAAKKAREGTLSVFCEASASVQVGCFVFCSVL